MSNLDLAVLEKEGNREGLVQGRYFLSEPDNGDGKDSSKQGKWQHNYC